MRNKAIACLGAIVACATALAGIPATAMADDSAGLTPQYTYNSQNDNGMTFEKVSHADQGLSQADGVVDYTGDGTIAPYTAGLSTTGNATAASPTAMRQHPPATGSTSAPCTAASACRPF